MATDWLLNGFIAAMGIEPETFKAQLAQTWQIILGAKYQLDRIERNQVAIMRHLQIADVELPSAPLTKGDEHGTESH